MKDMFSNVDEVLAIAPQAVGTTGAANGKTSSAIDLKGFGGITFIAARGVSAAATDTVNVVITEANATGDTFTSAADADLRGTEAGAVLLGSAGKASRIGYVGSKRYVKIKLYGIGTATAIVSAVGIKSHPQIAPVAQ